MSADSAAFLALQLPSYLRGDTTPEIAPEVRGLRLAAPAELESTPGLKLPISAVAQFADEGRAWPGSLWDHVVAVAVDVRSNQMWAATLANPFVSPTPFPTEEESRAPEAPDEDEEEDAEGEGEEEPEVDFTPDEPPAATKSGADATAPGPAQEAAEDDEPRPTLEAVGITRGYAHVDLRLLLGLPSAPARYWIHLALGPYQSNPACVTVVRARETE